MIITSSSFLLHLLPSYHLYRYHSQTQCRGQSRAVLTRRRSFLKIVSQVTAGGTVTDFSDRFTLSGMTGTFSTTVTQGLSTISGNSGPVGINTFSQTGTSAQAEAGSFTIPYYLQTGLIKYAPMQPIPPTKITANSATPLFPTSAYTIATTYMAIPSITLTVTDSQTFSVQSVANTVSTV